jgi:hypothetical protein
MFGRVMTATPKDDKHSSDDEQIDESSEESFPASDPPSWTMGRGPTPPELDAGPTPTPRRGEPGAPRHG